MVPGRTRSTSSTGRQHGTLGSDDGDATVVYTPTPGFIGTDSFTFRVGDGVANSGLATMSVVVQHYPGAAWETRTPDQVGLRSAALDPLAASIGGVGSVVRNGYMVYTWGDQTAKADWASAAKPVLHTLLFFAVQEKRIASLDDRIGSWVLAGTGGTLRPEDEPITFAQLMNMTSGYAVIDPPGAAWAYNDVASNLKNKLIGAILGEPLDAQLLTRLAPLQFQDGSLLTTRGGYGISTTTRDFARIGWFWMNRGNWRNQQVLSSTFFDEYMRTQVPGTTPRSAGPDVDYLNVGSVGGGTDQIGVRPRPVRRELVVQRHGRRDGPSCLARRTARYVPGERPLEPRDRRHDPELESPRRGARRVGHLRAGRPELRYEPAAANLDVGRCAIAPLRSRAIACGWLPRRVIRACKRNVTADEDLRMIEELHAEDIVKPLG